MSDVFDELKSLFAPTILAPDDFLKKRQPADTVLDVRTATEFRLAHLAGSIHIDVSASDFRSRASQLDLTGPIFLYCQSGSRSATAVAILRSLGASKAENIGGLASLVRAGAPIESPSLCT